MTGQNTLDLYSIFGVDPGGGSDKLRPHVRRIVEHAVFQEQAELPDLEKRFSVADKVLTVYMNEARQKALQPVSVKTDKEHSRAKSVRQRSVDVLDRLQDVMVSMLRTEHHLAVAACRLEEAYDFARENMTHSGDEPLPSGGQGSWGRNDDEILRKKIQRKDELENLLQRSEAARPVIEELEEKISSFEESLNNAFGAEKTQKIMRSIVNKLRSDDPSRAYNVLEEMAGKGGGLFGLGKQKKSLDSSLTDDLKSIVDQVEASAERLQVLEDKKFVRSSELKLSQDSLQSEFDKIIKALSKFRLPELRYRQAQIQRLKEQVERTGNLPQMLEWHDAIADIPHTPLPGEADCYRFETQVLNKIETTFGTMPDLEEVRADAAAILKNSRIMEEEER